MSTTATKVTRSELTEIAGGMYRVHFTVTEHRITVQRVTVQETISDEGRDIMQVMDKDILRGLHEDLVHRHLNLSA